MEQQTLIERLAAENIYASRGLAREDDTLDVGEDDRRAPGVDVQRDDELAGDHDD
jgi:hypothetical protein